MTEEEKLEKFQDHYLRINQPKLIDSFRRLTVKKNYTGRTSLKAERDIFLDNLIRILSSDELLLKEVREIVTEMCSDESRYHFVVDEYRRLMLRHENIGFRKIALIMSMEDGARFMDAIDTDDEKTLNIMLNEFFEKNPGFITTDLPYLCREVAQEVRPTVKKQEE